MAVFENEQKAKGLEKFITMNCQEMWGTASQVSEWKRIDLGMHNNFIDLSPEDFEAFIGNLFRKGYQVDNLQYVGDYGADLLAKKGGETHLGW